MVIDKSIYQDQIICGRCYDDDGNDCRGASICTILVLFVIFWFIWGFVLLGDSAQKSKPARFYCECSSCDKAQHPFPVCDISNMTEGEQCCRIGFTKCCSSTDTGCKLSVHDPECIFFEAKDNHKIKGKIGRKVSLYSVFILLLGLFIAGIIELFMYILRLVNIKRCEQEDEEEGEQLLLIYKTNQSALVISNKIVSSKLIKGFDFKFKNVFAPGEII